MALVVLLGGCIVARQSLDMPRNDETTVALLTGTLGHPLDGIAGWPDVPRGTDWKTGICRALGVSDPREMWRRVLAGVDSYADVEVPLLRAVEELIDFVTAPA